MALSESERRAIADIGDAAELAKSLAVQLGDARSVEDAIAALIGLTGQSAVLRDACAELAARLIESGGEG
jgi:hypothetical protein